MALVAVLFKNFTFSSKFASCMRFIFLSDNRVNFLCINSDTLCKYWAPRFEDVSLDILVASEAKVKIQMQIICKINHRKYKTDLTIL